MWTWGILMVQRMTVWQVHMSLRLRQEGVATPSRRRSITKRILEGSLRVIDSIDQILARIPWTFAYLYEEYHTAFRLSRSAHPSSRGPGSEEAKKRRLCISSSNERKAENSTGATMAWKLRASIAKMSSRCFAAVAFKGSCRMQQNLGRSATRMLDDIPRLMRGQELGCEKMDRR
ncbi:hypothetical protein K458DRAFT_93191 [Lentithecium fluviatile CBS 122367]|uniref:Uncharacterized protein n=1 Tax=Lentithecium fluviatile CBS 122367 TaxID=1168545 RepID=A0A6G1IQ57_9PLEO|nr:hypothetical protein K458DRAFT_93191 [Lentithecium fluviatile CBS 122367]